MINQIKKFKKNALALELVDAFTEEDVMLVKELFEEKLKEGFEHVNILIQVKDLSILKHMNVKSFLQGELWGIQHFKNIGRCAVVSHSGVMETVVNMESKILQVFSAALEEKYFDHSQLKDALAFIAPDGEDAQ